MSDDWMAKALRGNDARAYAASREANMPGIVEGEITRAQILWARYTALKDAGFTEDQALLIVVEGAPIGGDP